MHLVVSHGQKQVGKIKSKIIFSLLRENEYLYLFFYYSSLFFLSPAFSLLLFVLLFFHSKKLKSKNRRILFWNWQTDKYRNVSL